MTGGGGQMTNKGQTASNEDPIDIQVEDDDVDLKEFQEKRNNEDEKVPTIQNKGNKRRHRGDRSLEEKILSEQNQERKKGRKSKEKYGIDRDGLIHFVI
jgi:hypothetical protein